MAQQDVESVLTSADSAVDTGLQMLPLTTTATNSTTSMLSSTPTSPDNPRSSEVSLWPFWKKRNELHIAALHCQWRKALTILDTLGNPDTDTQVLEVHYEIAVFSIGAGKRAISFVEQLVRYLPDQSLANKNGDDITVLHAAAAVNNKAAAILLVERIPYLIYAVDNNGDYPIHRAARFGSREVLKHLMSVTDWDGDGVRRPIPAADGKIRLFLYVIEAKLFDIALDLMDMYPWVAIAKVGHQNRTALLLLSQMSSLLQFRGCCLLLWECFLCIFPLMKSISTRGKYVTMHLQAMKLLRRLCKEMKNSSEGDPRDIYQDAILKAATTGNVAVIREILEIFPSAISCQEPSTGLTILHLAIQYRQARVFSFIYQTGGYKHLNLEKQDHKGDNMLHMAAKLPISDFTGVGLGDNALSMQWELQWYTAVSRVINCACCIQGNSDHDTPVKVFVKEHKKLKAEAESWTKATANSCCIVAVLIITIMFAAAITVPGGNDTKGFPNFKGKRAFEVFAIADAVSLFTATYSLVMFLRLLTLNYQYESFLNFNTVILMHGVGTLYISLVSMMVAFTAVLFLVFGQKIGKFLSPSYALACLGVVAYGWQGLPYAFMFKLSRCRGILGMIRTKPLY